MCSCIRLPCQYRNRHFDTGWDCIRRYLHRNKYIDSIDVVQCLGVEYMYTNIYIYIYIYVGGVCVRACVRVYECVYDCVYAIMYVSICIYIIICNHV